MSNAHPFKSILFLSANPKNMVRLRLQEEEREIKRRLRLAGYGKVPIASESAVRTGDIQQALLDFKPQIVHFSGHGTEQDGLVFEDKNGNPKLVNAEALSDLFELFSSRVECVVLNACYSTVQAQSIARYVNYVVGMSKAIGDSAAIEFSTGFYSAVGAGKSFEFAYRLGCSSIHLSGLKGNSTPELLKRKIVTPETPPKTLIQMEIWKSNVALDEANTTEGPLYQICPACGYDKNPHSTQFCDACGSSLLKDEAAHPMISNGPIIRAHSTGSHNPVQNIAPTPDNKQNSERKKSIARPNFDLGTSGEIRIIGPRNSGKTTYLSALATRHELGLEKPLRAIEPLNEETVDLRYRAENILKEGLRLEPTMVLDPYSLPHYLFRIEIIPSFWRNPIRWLLGQNIRFSLSCKDFAGEFISELRDPHSSSYTEHFIDDCAFSSGLLIMIDSTDPSYLDKEYALALSTLCRELTFRVRRGGRKVNYRIAIVFSKADQNKIWRHRKKLDRFVETHFPHTKAVFQGWSKDGYCVVKYFACSAFGMMDKPPRPNVVDGFSDGNCGVLANAAVWQPFGLVGALYWLSTGKADTRL